jgi:hypothetical protein
MRSITSIPEREPVFRDIAFACLGIAIPSIVSAVATFPGVAQLPSWISITYLITGSTTLVVGIVCLFFDSKLGKISAHRVEDVLQDMREVRERSVHSEEKIGSETPPSAVTIG